MWRSINLRGFWDVLTRRMSVPVSHGRDDEALLSFVLLPQIVGSAALKVLALNSNSTTSLARVWHSQSKLAVKEETDFVTLNFDTNVEVKNSRITLEVPAVSNNSIRHCTLRAAGWAHLAGALGLKGDDVGLKITCHLNYHAIFYDDIHFDNLIASQVVQEAQRLGGWEWGQVAREIPCPLKVLWRNEQDLPYYAASVLVPAGEVVQDTYYFHKRAPPGRFSAGNKRTGKLKIDAMRGRWMERRIPFRATLTDKLFAYCVGDPREITRFLYQITHIGKKRSAGFGEVKTWDIEQCDIKPIDCIVKDRTLIKPLPMNAAAELGIKIDASVYLVGWTPPQWNPAAMEPGWAVRTKISLDK